MARRILVFLLITPLFLAAAGCQTMMNSMGMIPMGSAQDVSDSKAV